MVYKWSEAVIRLCLTGNFDSPTSARIGSLVTHADAQDLGVLRPIDGDGAKHRENSTVSGYKPVRTDVIRWRSEFEKNDNRTKMNKSA